MISWRFCQNFDRSQKSLIISNKTAKCSGALNQPYSYEIRHRDRNWLIWYLREGHGGFTAGTLRATWFITFLGYSAASTTTRRCVAYSFALERTWTLGTQNCGHHCTQLPLAVTPTSANSSSTGESSSVTIRIPSPSFNLHHREWWHLVAQSACLATVCSETFDWG